MASEINVMILNYSFMLIEFNYSIVQFFLEQFCLTFSNKFLQNEFHLYIDFQYHFKRFISGKTFCYQLMSLSTSDSPQLHWVMRLPTRKVCFESKLDLEGHHHWEFKKAQICFINWLNQRLGAYASLVSEKQRDTPPIRYCK